MTRERPSPARRSGALVVGTVLSAGMAASLLAGCGGSSGAPAATSASSNPSLGTVTTAPDGVQQVTIQTEDDYVFTPSSFTVHPGQVRLTVTNAAKQLTHNFRFTPGKGPEDIAAQITLLAPGQSQTIGFTVTQPGAYQFQCSFHVQLGQIGTMTVSG